MGSFDMNIIIKYFKMKVKKDNICLLFPFLYSLKSWTPWTLLGS